MNIDKIIRILSFTLSIILSIKMNLNEKYPHLRFIRNWEISDKSLFLLGQCEAYVNAISRTPILPEHYSKLMEVSLIKGAQATTAIEGNTLSEAEIKDIYDGKDLPESKEYQQREVQNILNALNELRRKVVIQKSQSIISPALIRRFHSMIGRNLGEYLDAVPGKFRSDQRTVGKYKCPDYRDIETLVDNLCKWLKREFNFPKVDLFHEVIIQAIVTHVYIEWIHPFSDGNGRTGRLLEFYILLRGGNPDIASHILSNHYNHTRTEYYRQIHKAYEKKDLTHFIEYALLGYRDGLMQTLAIIQKSQLEITWKKLVYDKFSNKIFGSISTLKRIRTLILEMPIYEMHEIKDIPYLNPPISRKYTSVKSRTVSRDLKVLLDMELLVKSGKFYKANIGLIKGFMPMKTE